MRRQALYLLVAAAIMGLGVPITTSAKAAYLLKYEEVGTDVVGKGSGSLDLTDLTLVDPGEEGSCFGVEASQAAACAGPLSVDIATYQGFVGPTSFGPGALRLATSGSGDFTGIIPTSGNLHPPGGYISGDSLFGEVTFAGADFQDLGLTPGVYVWSWGSGLHADTFTVQVGVPEPSSWALLLAGFGALGLVGCYRRTRRAEAIG
jgi:PEP-CTERM motif